MSVSALLMIAALVAPTAQNTSLPRAAEAWLNANYWEGGDEIHLSSVKADGTLVCAYGRGPFVDFGDAYLIDAAHWVAWTDHDPNVKVTPQRVFRMSPAQKVQWSRCEKDGAGR